MYVLSCTWTISNSYLSMHMLRMNVYLITYLSLIALDDPAEARWIEPEISKIVSPMAALPLIRTVHTYIDTVHTSTRLYMQMKRFKVSDKQLWYMKIQAMSTKGTSHSFKTAFTIHTFFTYIHTCGTANRRVANAEQVCQ